MQQTYLLMLGITGGRGIKRWMHIQKYRVGLLISDVPGPAQSREPGQAEPIWAGPSQAIGDGSAMALARLRGAESQSRRLRPRL